MKKAIKSYFKYGEYCGIAKQTEGRVVDAEKDKYDEDELNEYLGLPAAVELPDNIDPNDAADWLADEYGFCVISFSMLDEEYLHNYKQ